MANPIEVWKAAKHGFDVWPDIEKYAAENRPLKEIESTDLERLKWHGFLYRKRDAPGRYMNRVRITAGEMTAEQAREIAHIAYEYGHGIVDVTTRANVQVQGLEIKHVPKVVERFEKVGLSSKQTAHDNIRNVFAHPFSGLMSDELIDTRQLCHDVTALFVGSRVYSDLPRKMNICLNGTDQHSSHFWTQDISFLATKTSSGDVMFHLLLGGTQGQNPRLAEFAPVLVAPDQVVDVTRSILDLFRAKGSREKRNKARFRFLLEEIGVQGVLDWMEGDLLFPLQPSTTEPACATSHDELVGWFRQADPNLWTMGLNVPLGRMSWQQLEGLAVISKKWADGQLRATHEQGIAVINIPRGFKDAAASDAAGLGLSIHADDLDRNTIACTGSQFCNIAVTETKGQMLQLVEKLRKKTMKLHGIRIHMSGCPSSCAQHFTADIGLKGVRVRRILGTREGFDVYLGGGISGQVHMGLPYKLGVDVDQLPSLIDEVVSEYYIKHKSGQSFSAYWRDKINVEKAAKATDDDYQLPVWVCEACDHHHTGEDPPIFCPSCAGLRRYFARIEEGESDAASDGEAESIPVRDDGFVFAAKSNSLTEDEGQTVEVSGQEFALFRVEGKVQAIDSACPHEGAQLTDGEFKDGVVTCPWHSWTFNTCTGCSIDPPQNDVKHYETLEADGNIFVKTGAAAPGNGVAPNSPAKPRALKPIVALLPVLEVITETPDVRTFRLDNSEAKMPFDFPGKFAKVCVSIGGDEVWRSFTISSSPHDTSTIDMTIKRNSTGQVSNYLFDEVRAGSKIKLKGAQGGFFHDPENQVEPLVLISAGSGITPMMSMARYRAATQGAPNCHFLYCARTAADIIFHNECLKLAEQHADFKYHVSLTKPNEAWSGATGRLMPADVENLVPEFAKARYFLCGPNEFMNAFRESLVAVGVPNVLIHTEQFHASQPVSVTPAAAVSGAE